LRFILLQEGTVDILDTKTGEQTRNHPKLTIWIIQLLHHTTLSLLFLVVELIIISLGIEKAVIGESTPATTLLKDLLNLKNIVVGLYKFRDQTGQYKASENGSNFSTVTQGATSILIKALEDSKWFVPIERENIGNLLQERNLIPQDKNIQRC
jgi:hypothetical protein